MSKEISKTRTRVRYYLLRMCSFLIAIVPLFIFTLVKWNYIFEIKQAAKFANLLGFVFLMIFIAMIVMKKTQFLKGVGGFWIVTLILYCFKNIDISFMYAIALWSSVGMTLSKIFDVFITNEMKDKLEAVKTAEVTKQVNQANTDAIIDAIKEINGRG